MNKSKTLLHKNGLEEGLQISWYSSGEKKYETHYKNGEQAGLGIL
jgi:antitoxin component YwqK of YwqJK toxin-antitoxin module